MVKATIAAAEGLAAIIAAGGWVVVLIILIVCMIGLLIATPFGIFFSSEATRDGMRPEWAHFSRWEEGGKERRKTGHQQLPQRLQAG